MAGWNSRLRTIDFFYFQTELHKQNSTFLKKRYCPKTSVSQFFWQISYLRAWEPHIWTNSWVCKWIFQNQGMQSSERPWCHDVESSPLLPPSSPLRAPSSPLRRLSLPRVTTTSSQHATTLPPLTVKTPNFEDQFDAYLYQSQVRFKQNQCNSVYQPIITPRIRFSCYTSLLRHKIIRANSLSTG